MSDSDFQVVAFFAVILFSMLALACAEMRRRCGYEISMDYYIGFRSAMRLFRLLALLSACFFLGCVIKQDILLEPDRNMYRWTRVIFFRMICR